MRAGAHLPNRSRVASTRMFGCHLAQRRSGERGSAVRSCGRDDDLSVEYLRARRGSSGVRDSEDAQPQAWPALLIEHCASRGGSRQRESQWLNLRSPTSFHSGWQSGGCGCVLPDDPDERAEMLAHPTRSSGWTGEWEDRFGNIVRYSPTMAINADGRIHAATTTRSTPPPRRSETLGAAAALVEPLLPNSARARPASSTDKHVHTKWRRRDEDRRQNRKSR